MRLVGNMNYRIKYMTEKPIVFQKTIFHKTRKLSQEAAKLKQTETKESIYLGLFIFRHNLV